MDIIKPKSVFYIEDAAAQRIGLHKKLESRGFEVKSVATVAEARKTLKENNDFDVCLIDMMLEEDPDYNGVRGADIVIEYLQEKSRDEKFQKPESIILTAYRRTDFYEAAFKLGAISYLEKSKNTDEAVIRHLRALAIKRALTNNVKLAEKIEKVVQSSYSETELYENFCHDILSREFVSCLGAPFLLLLTEVDPNTPLRAKNCIGGTSNLPVGEDPIYREILSLMYLNSDISKPFILEDNIFNILNLDKSVLSEDQIKQLRGAAFISLPLSGNFRLTVGILKSTIPYSEPPDEIAKLLISYVNPAAIAFLSEIVVRWHRSDTERNTTIKKLTTFCYNVGKEQSFILQDAALRGENIENSTYSRIRNLAEDLFQTGKLLEPIAEKKYSSANLTSISAKEIMEAAWEEISSTHDLSGITFNIEKDCIIQVEKEEFLIITLRILEWFTRRKREVPESNTFIIKIKCSTTEDDAFITFEDNSWRLPDELRKNLFKPFSQAISSLQTEFVSEKYRPGLYLALYLSQIIIEEKYRGEIKECSNELDGSIGHKIKIKIPIRKNLSLQHSVIN